MINDIGDAILREITSNGSLPEYIIISIDKLKEILNNNMDCTAYIFGVELLGSNNIKDDNFKLVGSIDIYSNTNTNELLRIDIT